MIDIQHEDSILRTFILFVQSAQALLKYTDTHLYRKTRFSIVKLIVLRALVSNGGTMRPSELAEWTQTERHNITALIRRMGKEGLVKAERDSINKRNVNVTLTDKGREALGLIMPVAREIINQVMFSVSEGNALILEKLLRVLKENAQYGLEQLDIEVSLKPD